MVTAEFAYGESPLSSPQQAGGYPAEALYEIPRLGTTMNLDIPGFCLPEEAINMMVYK